MATVSEVFLVIENNPAPGCPYCGQIDPEPRTHLARVHDTAKPQPRLPAPNKPSSWWPW